MPFVPSKFQAALYAWISRQVAVMMQRTSSQEETCAVVEAVAGSGKTTTLKHALSLLPATMSAVFLAFNQSIKNELAAFVKEKQLKNCRAMTLNGLGMMLWLRSQGLESDALDVDEDKTMRILLWLCDPARQVPGSWPAPLQALARKHRPGGMPLGTIKKLVALMKHYVVVPAALAGKRVGQMGMCQGHRDDSDDELLSLADRFDLVLASDDPACDVSEADILDLARDALIVSIAKSRQVIDYDDQIYLPVIFRVKCRPYDWIFVDEAQDVSHANRALLHMIRGQHGRLVAVGDSGQAIYGFRGAASDSMELIRQEFRAVALPLALTYRCAKAIVREAQKLVPQIEALPDAPEGEVLALASYTIERFRPGKCLIMCRNLAPLVGFAYRLLVERVPVRVLGRDIGKGLIAFMWSLRPSSLTDLVIKAREWAEQQQEIILKGSRRRGGSKNEAQLQAIQDRLETILILCKESGARDVEGIEAQIMALFGDEDAGKVLLSTIHKAKGLEQEEAYLLEPDLLPSPYARKPWQRQQELNLMYVAITRGRRVFATITRAGLKLQRRAA